MEELKVISEKEVLGKEFRIYGTVDAPLFLAKDVAEFIDYSFKDSRQIHRDVSKMLCTVDDEEKLKSTINLGGEDYSHGGIRENTEMWFLTEDGLYEVLMQSRKPIAKQFKKEVKNILKQIRLTGGTISRDREEDFINNYFPSFSEDVKMAMVQDLRKQNEEYKQKIEQQKPLVEFAETVSISVNSISVGDFAKLLYDEDIKLGQNKLFKWLRNNKYLMENNTPYQKYMDNGIFEVIEQTYKTPYGEKTSLKTLITGRGQIVLTETLRKVCK